MMTAVQRRSNRVIFWLLTLSTFAIPHLIDDFLFNIPREFGISIWSAQILAGLFTLTLVGAGLLTARDKPSGYRLCTFLGAFLGLAVLAYHVPGMLKPGPYWSGLLSEILILGLLTASIGLFATSIPATRQRSGESA
ncbi:MAG: hypothetical protein PVI04_10095 [Anaerolineales bacterium]|jgi:hypothetical protein